MKKVLVIGAMFLLVASGAQASLSPLAGSGEVVVFSDDFDNNDKGWSNIGSGSGKATIGTDPGGTGATVWYPSVDSDSGTVDSLVALGTGVDTSAGPINMYFRMRIDDLTSGNPERNRGGAYFTESSSNRMGSLYSMPNNGAASGYVRYMYYDSDGVSHSVNSTSPAANYPDTSTFRDFMLRYTDNGNGSMTLAAFMYDGGSYVAFTPEVTNADLNSGVFSKLHVLSRNHATGGANRIYMDSVRVTTTAIPEPSALLLLGGGLLGLLVFSRHKYSGGLTTK